MKRPRRGLGDLATYRWLSFTIRIDGVKKCRVGNEPRCREGVSYRPKISNERRDVRVSIDVYAQRYVSTVCTAEEEFEIAGYRSQRG